MKYLTASEANAMALEAQRAETDLIMKKIESLAQAGETEYTYYGSPIHNIVIARLKQLYYQVKEFSGDQRDGYSCSISW